MSKAEEAALKAYPVKMSEPYKYWDGSISEPIDINRPERRIYAEGYEQAEKETIERACKWLDDNAWIVDINKFRNAMEEE